MFIMMECMRMLFLLSLIDYGGIGVLTPMAGASVGIMAGAMVTVLITRIGDGDLHTMVVGTAVDGMAVITHIVAAGILLGMAAIIWQV